MLKPLILLIALWAGSPLWASVQTVEMPGGRSYRIDLPPAPKGAPIILGLHGGGGNPDQFARNTGLSEPALAQGYAVIYPAGSGRGRLAMLAWNAGYCCGRAASKNIDDLAFLGAVIADAAQRFGLDATRVYLTGMSNGSMLAERYAALNPTRVKAVAGISGTMDLSAPVTGPVPLLHIHGTADTHVPYSGGKGSAGLTATVFSPVDGVIASFLKADGALTGPGVQAIIDPADDGMRVIEHEWRDAAGRPMVRLLAVEGGGHVWPGGQRSETGGTLDINANTEVLRFFADHH